jgi:hypothetical protein
MNALTPNDRDRLGRIYLVANTPSYLYRHFRRDSSVIELARATSTDALAGFVREVQDLPERSPTDVAAAYAAVVALTFHDPERVRAEMGDISESALAWIGPILKLWYDSFIATQIVEIPYKPQILPQRHREGASSNTTVITLLED